MKEIKWLGIHRKGGFAAIEVGEDSFLFHYPYLRDSLSPVSKESVRELIQGENWFVFSEHRLLKDISILTFCMMSELTVNHILRLNSFESSANKGKLINGDDKIKVDQLITKLKSRLAHKEGYIDLAYDLSSVSFVYKREKEQQEELNKIMNQIINEIPEVSMVPYENNTLDSSIIFHDLFEYMSKDMQFQKRYSVVTQVIKFLLFNKQWFDQGVIDDLDNMYKEMREKAANAKGYSTYGSHKKTIKDKNQRFISRRS